MQASSLLLEIPAPPCVGMTKLGLTNPTIREEVDSSAHAVCNPDKVQILLL